MKLFPVFVSLLGVGAGLGLTAAPQLGVSVRGLDRATLTPGEPLRIGVRVFLDNEKDAALALPKNWHQAVTITLTGGGASLSAQLVHNQDDDARAVTFEDSADALWWIPSKALAALPPGAYTVKATLASPVSLTDDCPVTFSADNAAADPAHTVLAQAHEAVLAGDPAAAARHVDAALSKNADNIELLLFRALLCLEGNDRASALACFNRALRLTTLDTENEPCGRFIELERRLAFSADSSPLTEKDRRAAWSRPPAIVFEVPEAVRAKEQAAPGTTKAAPSVTPSTTATAAPAPTSASIPAKPTSSASAPTTPTAPVVSVPPATKPADAGNFSGKVVPAPEFTEALVAKTVGGQWAVAATASSQYEIERFAPGKATGAPNVSVAGNDPESWCPKNRDQGIEWLELEFARAVNATEVRVRQNYTPGSIVKLEAIDDAGQTHLWWQGRDPYVPPRVADFAWFVVRVPSTDYRVKKIRLTLDLSLVSGWKEIDAVQLVGK